VVDPSSNEKNSAVGTDVALRWIGSSRGPPPSQTPTAEFDVPKSMAQASVMGSAQVRDGWISRCRGRDLHRIGSVGKSDVPAAG